MKAISTVIATVLMLMIVIGLGGTAYLFISGTFTSKTASTFEVIDEVNGTVTIRNSGTEPITRITATLDGSSANIAVTPQIDRLVSYWSMNEGRCPVSGACTTDDNSENNNVGTLNNFNFDANSGWLTDTRFGSGLHFDGTNDYVEMPDSVTNSFTGPFSISLWFKIDTILPAVGGNAAVNTLISKGDRSAVRLGVAYNIRITPPNSPGSVVFDVLDDSVDARIGTLTTNRVSTGVWYHLVASWDGGRTAASTRIFLNSEEWFGKDSNPIPPPDVFASLQDSNQPVQIGRGTESGIAAFFDGAIDEVSFYNRALSESEINQLYSGLISPGQLATIKPLSPLSKGTHTLRLCTGSACNTAVLTII